MVDIYLFTHSFPYTKNIETFLETEMKIISEESAYKLHVIPLLNGSQKRDLPENVVLDNTICNYSFLTKLLILISLFFSFQFWCSIRIKIFFRRKELFDFFKYYYGALQIKRYIFIKRKKISQDDIFYSYWFSFAPLGFALAKGYKWFKKNRCISRAHGFDVYGVDRGVYIPRIEFTLSQIDMVYVVSVYGCNYMQKKYFKFKDKISVSRLGVQSKMQKKNENVVALSNDYNLISCSNLSSIKRVPLIFSSIYNFCKENTHIKIRWTHIGGGGNEDNLLKTLIDSCVTNNLEIILTGNIMNNEVYDIYYNNRFHAFINLSVSEGIPVSIMEAISFSIPILATDVGGTREIVTEDSGLLLPKNFSQEMFNEKLKILLNKNRFYSKTIPSFFEENYSANSNYLTFYNNILRIK